VVPIYQVIAGVGADLTLQDLSNDQDNHHNSFDDRYRTCNVDLAPAE
jgi:hypothetical protein